MNETAIPPGVRAIFFDAVGTLIRPEPSAPSVYAAIGRRFGSRLDETTIATRFSAAFQCEEEADRAAGWKTSEGREIGRWRRIVGEVLADSTDPEACFQALFAHFARPQSWRIEADTAPVLSTLAARGYALGVASNYDHRLRSVAAGLPEFNYFAHVVISAEIGWRKPASEFFAALRDQAQLEAAQILFVGNDMPNDYDGARAAGLHAVLVDTDGRFSCSDRISRLRELLSAFSLHR